MAKSKVRLIVCGVECDLASDENESYVRSIGAEVDESVRKITKETSGLPKSVINVLALMNFCDKARKANEALENLNIRMKEFLGTAAKSQVACEKLKEENGQLKREMERLRKQNR